MRHLLVLACALLLAACDGGGTGASAPGGEFIAALRSPHGPEGAVLLEVAGAGLTFVGTSSASLFQQPVSGGWRVMLVREPAGVIEFRVHVTPGNELPSVRVLEVVDAEDRMRPDTEGYTVEFTPARGDE